MNQSRTVPEIVKILADTGHLQYPFGRRQDCSATASNLPVTHPVIEKALASFQDFMVNHLEPLTMQHHGRPARCDGGMGPATADLFAMPRCGCPDYGESVAAATGTGSWMGCHGVGNFHAATAYIDDQHMPGYLKPIFDEVWEKSAAAYADIGLRWARTVIRSTANTILSFDRNPRGWIGLAIVGRGQSCDSQIWLKLSAKYEPANLTAMIIELLMHELGHNASLQHTRGGIMAPVISQNPVATWKGDPSESVLNRYYGGKPIDTPTPEPPVDPTPPTPGPPTDKVVIDGGILHLSDGREFDATFTPRAT